MNDEHLRNSQHGDAYEDLYRPERIDAAIRECIGVLEGYDLNLAEAAIVCSSIHETAKKMIADKVEQVKADSKEAGA